MCGEKSHPHKKGYCISKIVMGAVKCILSDIL